MSDPEMSKPVSEPGGSIQNIFEGGLLRLIVSKPVQETVGRLVFGLVDVPLAYLENWSRNVRRETEAKDAVSSALLSASIKKLNHDDDLVGRAQQRWLSQLKYKQANREDVAIAAVQILAESPALENAASPSEDFMTIFEDIVERISSKELSDLMARILAGEIRKPGSISRKTLQIVSILDKQIVEALIELYPYMLDGHFWVVPKSKLNHWRTLFALLSSVSITNSLGIRHITPDENGHAVLGMGTKGILLSGLNQKFGVAINGANLTPAGTELVSILPITNNRMIDELMQDLKETPYLKRVDIVSLDENSNVI